MKETGVDDEGLNEFATEYFPHPTYKDEALTFYSSLGSGEIAVGYNPFSMIKLIWDGMNRAGELDVKGHNYSKGEDFIGPFLFLLHRAYISSNIVIDYERRGMAPRWVDSF